MIPIEGISHNSNLQSKFLKGTSGSIFDHLKRTKGFQERSGKEENGVHFPKKTSVPLDSLQFQKHRPQGLQMPKRPISSLSLSTMAELKSDLPDVDPEQDLFSANSIIHLAATSQATLHSKPSEARETKVDTKLREFDEELNN